MEYHLGFTVSGLGCRNGEDMEARIISEGIQFCIIPKCIYAYMHDVCVLQRRKKRFL